jgi:adenylate cyclase
MNKQTTASSLSVVQVQLRQLKKRTQDASQLLKQQHQILRQRGMTLPSSAIDGLRNLRTGIDSLSRMLLDSQVELRQLRKLADTSALINSAQETDEVLNQVMETVIQLTQAERGYIVLRNRETDELEFRVARGMGADESEDSQRIVSWSVINKVAESGEPVLTDNAATDANINTGDSILTFSLRSILAVPLNVRGKVIGVAYCDNRIQSGLFKQNELELMTSFGQQAAVAIENARLFEDIRAQLASIEEMQTQLYNIFASIATGVITINGDDYVIVYNEAAEKITGSEYAIGHPLKDVLPDVTERFYERLAQVRESREQMIWGEQFVHDGQKRYWQVVASPLRGEDMVDNGLALVIDDLTERKAQEEQLKDLATFVPSAILENIESLDELDTSPTERVISAMFADIRGFTSFSENLQPEDLMKIINRYLSVASDAITLFEGIVDKYMGDAVTGLWNTQLNNQEDHARLAVQAAQAVIFDLYALHEVLEPDQQLYFGIGIHTGPSILGMVGGETRLEFAALGEAMDDCKFLQESAGPGEIIISPQTYELVKDYFEAEPMAPLKEKRGYNERYPIVYKIGKRKKTMDTSSLFMDDELRDLLADMDD